MDKCREQFEEWAKDKYILEVSKYGGYRDVATKNAFDAWQASRQALAVGLPKGDFAAWVSGDMVDGYKAAIGDVIDLLDAAGVNHK